VRCRFRDPELDGVQDDAQVGRRDRTAFFEHVENGLLQDAVLLQHVLQRVVGLLGPLLRMLLRRTPLLAGAAAAIAAPLASASKVGLRVVQRRPRFDSQRR
jgi:hypothetical protein